MTDEPTKFETLERTFHEHEKETAFIFALLLGVIAEAEPKKIHLMLKKLLDHQKAQQERAYDSPSLETLIAGLQNAL